MAIAVSQAYKDVHARRSGKRARVVVRYKRRYFDAGAVAFAYEANWQVLRHRDIVDPGEIVDQLDTAEPNVFKSSTVTLRLNNAKNQWVRSVNDPSVFAADALSANGYYDDQTIFQVLYGYELPDGTWEDCPQFTGYAFDYTPIPRMGHMDVAISASLLAEKCAATKVNTPVTGESMALSVVDEPLNPSPGDGTTAILKTTATGVISVANVKANGTALTLTTDYTVSIPTDGTAAAITLVSPAAQSGKALTWSGVTKDLLTTSSGVTLIAKVYQNGTVMTQGADYTISIPSVVGPGQITLVDPTLWVGKTFTWDGSKGSLNKTVEQAVAMYCDAAGITSGARSIQTVLFPGGLSSSKTINTQTDWAAGTLLQNVSTTGIPGSLIRKWYLLDDFSDGDYTANPTWTVAANNGSISVSSSALNVATSDLTGVAVPEARFTTLYTPFSKADGCWRFRAKGNIHARFLVDSAAMDGFGMGVSTGNGYTVQISQYNDSITLVGSGVLGSAGSLSLGSGYNEIRVTRSDGGLISVFLNGTAVITVTDMTYSTPGFFIVSAPARDVPGYGWVGQSGSITDIYWSQDQDGVSTFSSATATGEYQFDLLATPTALGTLDHFEVLNGGSLVLKTACAPDSGGTPGTYDALQALGAGNAMVSTPRRWLKIHAELTPAVGAFISPELQKLVAHFTASTVTLSLVAPTSGTAWDKIQVYARMCNYETGWDATGKFFFRSRTVSGDAVVDLDPWTNIVDLDDTHPGWDRVFNIGHASQPPYEYYYGKDDAGEAEPTSERRFGPIPRDLNFSGELVANDAQIGRAAAQTSYQDNHLPRWRCRISGKLVPWLEMSDPVNVNFVTDPKMLDVVAGDPLQKDGFAGAQGVALAIKKKMKVVGRTKKLKGAIGDLLLEEILS